MPPPPGQGVRGPVVADAGRRLGPSRQDGTRVDARDAGDAGDPETLLRAAQNLWCAKDADGSELQPGAPGCSVAGGNSAWGWYRQHVTVKKEPDSLVLRDLWPRDPKVRLEMVVLLTLLTSRGA